MRVCIKLLHVCHENAVFCPLESWVCIVFPSRHLPVNQTHLIQYKGRICFGGDTALVGRRLNSARSRANTFTGTSAYSHPESPRTASRRSRHAMPDQTGREASTSPEAFVVL